MCNAVVVQLQSSYYIHKLILQIMNKQENLSSKSSFDSLPQNSITQIKEFLLLSVHETRSEHFSRLMQQEALVDPVIFTDSCKTSKDSSLN